MNHRSLWSALTSATALAVLASACSNAPTVLTPMPLGTAAAATATPAAATATPTAAMPTLAPATPTPSPASATPTPTPTPVPTSSAITFSVSDPLGLSPQNNPYCKTTSKDFSVSEAGYSGTFTATSSDTTVATVAPKVGAINTFTATSAMAYNSLAAAPRSILTVTDTAGNTGKLNVILQTCLP